MKISQLIKKLEEAKLQHGDVGVCFPDFGDYGGYVDVETLVPEYPWKDADMLVEDKEAGIAFVCLK